MVCHLTGFWLFTLPTIMEADPVCVPLNLFVPLCNPLYPFVPLFSPSSSDSFNISHFPRCFFPPFFNLISTQPLRSLFGIILDFRPPLCPPFGLFPSVLLFTRAVTRRLSPILLIFYFTLFNFSYTPLIFTQQSYPLPPKTIIFWKNIYSCEFVFSGLDDSDVD